MPMFSSRPICLALAGLGLSLWKPVVVAQSTEQGLEEVVVFGSRHQNEQSIDFKRNQLNIVDSIAQDDLGRQPDYNTGDALRRAPGVTAVFDEDEATFVTVRGLNPDFTLVQFDGYQMASSNEGSSRRVFLEAIPPSIVKRLDVIKTRTPDMDGNAIGGTINLVTRSAYDTDDTFLVASAMGGRFTQDSVPYGFDDSSGDNSISGRVNGTFTTQFGDQNQFGLVVAGEYLNKDRDEHRAIPISYAFSDATPTNLSSAAPGGGPLIWSSYHAPIERSGGIVKLEWKPSDRLYASVEGLYFFGQDWNGRNSRLLIPFIGPDFETQYTGSFEGPVLGIVGQDDFTSENLQKGLKLTGEYFISQNSVIDVGLSLSNGEYTHETDDIDFNTVSDQLSYQYDVSSGFPAVTFMNPAFANDPANYPLVDIKPTDERFTNDVNELSADYSWRYNEPGWGFKAGLRLRESEQNRDRNVRIFSHSGPATLADFIAGTPYPTTAIGLIGADQLLFENAAVLEYQRANPDSFAENTSASDRVGSDYVVEEDVWALHVGASYTADRFQSIFGVRYEDTEVRSTGFDSDFNPIEGDGGYSNVLPSALAVYDLTTNTKLRMSYYRALGRANIGDLRAASAGVVDQNTLTVSGGNPNLKPRLAENFDVSLEHYFDEGQSLVSLALFYKDIDDEIFNVTSQSTDASGVTTVTSIPVNTSTATVRGMEFNFVKSALEFLPSPLDGFGFSANLTYLDAESELVGSNGLRTDVDFVFEQPDLTANVALFYQYDRFEARASYNYTSEYRADFAGNPRFDDVVGEYDTLDLQARYAINDNFTLMAEIRNIWEEERTKFTGPGQFLYEDRSFYGRSWFIGASFKL